MWYVANTSSVGIGGGGTLRLGRKGGHGSHGPPLGYATEYALSQKHGKPHKKIPITDIHIGMKRFNVLSGNPSYLPHAWERAYIQRFISI